ncbi:MAG: hypothetical protein ABIR70_04185 [Bryobacteraceae bacterium]
MGRLLGILLLAASTALAQWADYPGKKVDLAAPAPRTAWDTPDLSGIWENVRGAKSAEGKPPLSSFANVGAGFKDGALPLQPWAAELLKQRRAANSKDNPDARCLPMGLMQFHMHPQPRKIVQTPELLLIIYEANSGLRQIFLDGRALPGKDADPWWYGYSVGHWEGDTLVVETVRMKDLGWLDVWGSPITEDGKIIERFTRTSYGSLEIAVTIDDPKTYTAPFTVGVVQRVMPNADLIEFICAENDKFTSYLEGAGQK